MSAVGNFLSGGSLDHRRHVFDLERADFELDAGELETAHADVADSGADVVPSRPARAGRHPRKARSSPRLCQSRARRGDDGPVRWLSRCSRNGITCTCVRTSSPIESGVRSPNAWNFMRALASLT